MAQTGGNFGSVIRMSRTHKRSKQVYALYNGDEWIWDGTIKEIADHTKIKEENLLYLTYESVKKRRANDIEPVGMWLEPIDFK